MTSTTTATCARDASAGVNATSTRTGATTLLGHGRCDEVLPPPGPRDVHLVLGVRPPDLHGVHDPGAGRPALPRSLGPGAGRHPRPAGRAAGGVRGGGPRRHPA